MSVYNKIICSVHVIWNCSEHNLQMASQYLDSHQKFQKPAHADNKTITLWESFLVSFSTLSLTENRYSFDNGDWQMEGREDLGWVVIVLLHLALGVWGCLVALTSEHTSLSPNYMFDLLRAETVFYTYRDLPFWAFWNSCVLSILLTPEKQVLAFKSEKMLTPWVFAPGTKISGVVKGTELMLADGILFFEPPYSHVYTSPIACI